MPLTPGPRKGRSGSPFPRTPTDLAGDAVDQTMIRAYGLLAGEDRFPPGAAAVRDPQTGWPVLDTGHPG